jgi:hypothetical protein
MRFLFQIGCFLLMSSLAADRALASDLENCVIQNFARSLAQKAYRLTDRVYDTWSHLRLRDKFSDFDYDKFQRAKLHYFQEGPGTTRPETLEEQIAFIEAFSRRFIIDEKSSATDKKAAIDMAEELFPVTVVNAPQYTTFRLPNKVSQSRIEKVLVRQYKLVFGAPDSIRSSLTEDKETALRRSIIARIENSIARLGAVKAFEEVGLLKDPTLVDKYRDFARRNDGKLSVVINAALNTPSVLHGQYVPSFIPKSPITKEVAIPPEILDKIWNEGIDAAYPDIKELFQKEALKGRIPYNSAEFDHRWNTLQKWLDLGLTAWFGTQTAIKTWHKAQEFWAEYQAWSEEDRQRADQKINETQTRDLDQYIQDASKASSD